MEKKTVETGYGIVVANRGWVFAGEIEKDSNGCVIKNALNIRRWGTTEGLGQIAKNGPTEKTKYDTYGTVTIPIESVVLIIDADRSKWTQ